MSMYNLSEYSDSYPVTSGSLWNYWRDEVINDANKNNDGSNYKINNNKTTASRSFEYKTEIIKRTPANNALNTGVVVLLKYLSNFLRSLDLSLINCEIELDLS